MDLGRLLVVFGVVMVVTGLLLQYGPSLPVLGKLPGDLRIERGGLRIYFPLASGLLISLVVTLVLQLFSRLR